MIARRSGTLLTTEPTTFDGGSFGPAAHTGDWWLEVDTYRGRAHDSDALFGVTVRARGYRLRLRRQGWASVKVIVAFGPWSRTVYARWTDGERRVSPIGAPPRELELPERIVRPVVRRLHERNLRRWAARPVGSYED